MTEPVNPGSHLVEVELAIDQVTIVSPAEATATVRCTLGPVRCGARFDRIRDPARAPRNPPGHPCVRRPPEPLASRRPTTTRLWSCKVLPFVRTPRMPRLRASNQEAGTATTLALL
ncbi:hypothetical protein [Streptomyces sp. NPDC002122]|uniref:hypothetical protein n=1 Tax=Streptomyces sp. NPDC002122 TaxID=3154407 RepID=UPI00331F131F